MLGASLCQSRRANRSSGLRAFVCALPIALLWSAIAAGHHSVIGVYDDQQRFSAEVEVRSFELIDPHPLIFIEITALPGGPQIDGISVGQTWTLEMDNARELRALGFNRETFVPGDRLVVAVDPSRHTRYRENTLYVRGLEHQRARFIYIHNVRQLIPVESTDDNLSRYIHRVR